MCNTVIWLSEAKCVAGKVNPPEEIGLTLLHLNICCFHIFKIFVKGSLRRKASRVMN